MIKKLGLFAAFVVLCGNLFAQSKISKVITSLTEIVQAINNATATLKPIANSTIEINSVSKAYFGNGHTRNVVRIVLPKGTEKWFYRITVMDIKSDYSYPENESFYYVLSNNISQDHCYTPTTDGVDFFLLGTSGDANSFLETGNNNFSSISNYDKLKTNSFYGQSDLIQDNLWIGVRNNNKLQGLKVIVEAVAWGHY